jgi:hypothetical protein
MTCEKCSYQDKKEVEKFGKKLCSICNSFSPEEESHFNSYINEKIDWRVLETFRKYGQKLGNKQKKGMEIKARQGKLMSRVALGYSLVEGKLIENESASKVHSMFKEYLESPISLNQLSKKNNLSINGLKKILSNRTYLGEIKFNGQIFKGDHKPLITSEIFYAVQRKLKEIK